MAEYVSCPSCKTRLKVPDEMVGQNRTVKCPKCAHAISLAGVGAAAAPPDEEDELETVEGEDEAPAKLRKSAKRRRDEDEDDQDRPRGRKKRSRDDEEDEDYDDRPARRKPRKAKGKSGGNLGLIIGLAAGVGVLLLAGCGIGAYFLFFNANPAVTDENFAKVQTDMALQAVEDIFGAGSAASGADAKALLAAGAGPRMGGGDDPVQAAADNPQAYGITAWYRWKNGPKTMIIAVDAAKKDRIAGLVTITGNGTSSNWKSSLQRGGGGGPPPPPVGPGRGRK